jgi:hypothetical protein
MIRAHAEVSLERIGSICELLNGRAFTPEDWATKGLPIVRIQNLNNPVAPFNKFDGEVRPRFLIGSGALLFAWSGTPGTSFGAHIWEGGPAILNQHIFNVVFDETRIDKKFFYFALNQKVDELIGKAHGGVGLQHVTKRVLENTEIYLPSLDEQHRIVDILSRAEGIVRLCREAQAKAQAVIPTLFVEMFGDPKSNPKRWPLRAVRDIVARFEGGKNLQAGSEGGSRYQILKVSAVTSGNYIETENKPAPEFYEPPKSHFVRVGDMLFSRANTEALVGATAIVESTDGKTLLPDKLWRFIWSEAIDQRYMHALFQNQHIRCELGKLSTGTSASMRNISQEKLYRLRLPIAPIELQTAFGEQVETLQSVLALQRKAVKWAVGSFNSILARAFRGDLRIS